VVCIDACTPPTNDAQAATELFFACSAMSFSDNSFSDSETELKSGIRSALQKERSVVTRTPSIAKRKASQNPTKYLSGDYDPLPAGQKGIRLLSLLPAERDADRPPYCELVTIPVHSKNRPIYEALSWCWGPEDKNRYIRLQKRGRTYAKYVSSNLFAALKALRHETDSRYLWVDAICIDQEKYVRSRLRQAMLTFFSFDEKNRQVAMMDEIYRNADRVCIWLGDSNDSSQVALRFIKRIAQLQSIDFLSEGKDAPRKWAALFDLMQRPWFSRRWVVQEIALAQKARVHVGVESVAWEAFVIAVQSFIEFESVIQRLSGKDRHHRGVPGWFENVSALGASMLVQATEGLFRRTQSYVEAIEGSVKSESDGSDSEDGHELKTLTSHRTWESATDTNNHMKPLLTLEYLVSSLTMFGTSFAHDTVYALLALAKDAQPRAVGSLDPEPTSAGVRDYLSERKEYFVDYNLPYVDICKDFIEFAIRESLRHNGTQALDILCRPWATDEQTLANARRDKLRVKQKRDKDVLRAHLERSSSLSARIESLSPWNAGTMNSALLSQSDGEMPLPSWVPQISEAPYVMGHRPGISGMTLIRRNADPLVGQPHTTQHSYSAAGNKTVDLQSFRFRKRLETRDGVSHLSIYLRGLLLDTVEVVGEVARNGQIPKEWADLGDWVNAKGPAPDEFWQTLVAGRGEKGVNPPAYYPRACSEAFRRGGIESGALDTTGIINYEANSAVAQFCRRVRDVTWNRALIKTKSGRLGLVRRDVAIGDRICILYGCSVPVVLRENSRKPEMVVVDETKRELKYMKRMIVESYRRRMEMKKLHQKRKTASMLSICRRWLRATGWLRVNDFARRKLEVPRTTEGFRKLLRLAFDDFSSWRCEERARAWTSEYHNSTLFGEPHSDYKADDFRSLKRNTLQGSEQANFKRQRLAAGTARTTAKGDVVSDRAIGTQETTNTADWWDFDVALAAGRRWRSIVKDRKKLLAEAGWATIRAEDQARKAAEFAAFEKWRRSEGKWWTQLSDRWIQLKDSTPSPEITKSHQPILPVTHTKTSLNDPIFIFADDQVRPSWKKPANRSRLTREEGKMYNVDIQENVRTRSGDDLYRSWRMLGDCYVHGMMDGQAIRLQNEEDIPSIVFEIR
jgi:hypothetical protein